MQQILRSALCIKLSALSFLPSSVPCSIVPLFNILYAIRFSFLVPRFFLTMFNLSEAHNLLLKLKQNRTQ